MTHTTGQRTNGHFPLPSSSSIVSLLISMVMTDKVMIKTTPMMPVMTTSTMMEFMITTKTKVAMPLTAEQRPNGPDTGLDTHRPLFSHHHHLLNSVMVDKRGNDGYGDEIKNDTHDASNDGDSNDNGVYDYDEDEDIAPPVSPPCSIIPLNMVVVVVIVVW